MPATICQHLPPCLPPCPFPAPKPLLFLHIYSSSLPHPSPYHHSLFILPYVYLLPTGTVHTYHHSFTTTPDWMPHHHPYPLCWDLHCLPLGVFLGLGCLGRFPCPGLPTLPALCLPHILPHIPYHLPPHSFPTCLPPHTCLLPCPLCHYHYPVPHNPAMHLPHLLPHTTLVCSPTCVLPFHHMHHTVAHYPCPIPCPAFFLPFFTPLLTLIYTMPLFGRFFLFVCL